MIRTGIIILAILLTGWVLAPPSWKKSNPLIMNGFNLNDQVVKREDIETFVQKGLLGAETQTAVTKTRNISQDIRSKPKKVHF